MSESGTDAGNEQGEGEVTYVLYRAKVQAEELAGFAERFLARLEAGIEESEIEFEGVDAESLNGLWLVGLGGYLPTTSFDEEDLGDESLTWPAQVEGELSDVAIEWADTMRASLVGGWGEPMVYEARLVGSEKQPEGILDYLLNDVGIDAVDLWDRGAHFAALATYWSGEVGASDMRSMMLVLPREMVLGSFSQFLSDDDAAFPRLMHGESLDELRRRAWILSQLSTGGIAFVDSATGQAERYTRRAQGDSLTEWTFTADGRALVLFYDTGSELATKVVDAFAREELGAGAGEDAAVEVTEELRLDALGILSLQVMKGVPRDLWELAVAPGRNEEGVETGPHLRTSPVGADLVPLLTGAAWFDEGEWRVPPPLLEIAHRNGLVLDDIGFNDAVERPYRLGGDFVPESLASVLDSPFGRAVEAAFARCPHPAQPRPEGLIRLGYGAPSDETAADLAAQIEALSERWWGESPTEDSTFSLGDSDLVENEGTLTATLALADAWTFDELQAWTTDLASAMTERWGPSQRLTARTEEGFELRSPAGRVMRSAGLTMGPMWWVGGHAVVLIFGMPDPGVDTRPSTMLVISRADAVIDLLSDVRYFELRLRLRVLSELSQIAADRRPAGAEGEVAGSAVERPAVWRPHRVAWSGGDLAHYEVSPTATRGVIRAQGHLWLWTFTHDGRGLLISTPLVPEGDQPAATFGQQRGLFAGIPYDLLDLVTDPELAQVFPTVTAAPGEAPHPGEPQSLPRATAVFWHDEVSWRAAPGWLYSLRSALAMPAVTAEDGSTISSPLRTLYSEAFGVPQLRHAVGIGDGFRERMLVSEGYGRGVFPGPIGHQDVIDVYDAMGRPLDRALVGDLNELLDVFADAPPWRFLLDAALSNPDPVSRREIGIWLTSGSQKLDASAQLSGRTPVNILFENPTLGEGDGPLLRKILLAGAPTDAGLLGVVAGRHPLVQLIERELPEDDFLPLASSLIATGTLSLEDAALADGTTLGQYLSERRRPNRAARESVSAMLEGFTRE